MKLLYVFLCDAFRSLKLLYFQTELQPCGRLFHQMVALFENASMFSCETHHVNKGMYTISKSNYYLYNNVI